MKKYLKYLLMTFLVLNLMTIVGLFASNYYYFTEISLRNIYVTFKSINPLEVLISQLLIIPMTIAVTTYQDTKNNWLKKNRFITLTLKEKNKQITSYISPRGNGSVGGRFTFKFSDDLNETVYLFGSKVEFAFMDINSTYEVEVRKKMIVNFKFMA